MRLFIGRERHARHHRKAAHAARQTPFDGLWQRRFALNGQGQAAFNQRGQLAVMHVQLLRRDLECIQRIAIACGVNASVHHGQPGVVKVAADAGKQIGLIGGVHQHLHPFTGQRLAGAHDGHGAAHVARQLARMPGNVRWVVAHEVAHVQRVPQRFLRLVGLGRKSQLHQCIALACLYQRLRIGRAATQYVHGVVKQVFQQFALPGVPYLGAGAPNVGHRQQVQGGQLALIAHTLGEGANDVGVRRVLFLRNGAHLQVLAHQKFHQFSVFAGHVVLARKALDLNGANF